MEYLRAVTTMTCMSSPERDDELTGPSAKAQEAQGHTRACDHYCRRKKIKCDGPQRDDQRRSKCISRRTECTYVEPLKITILLGQRANEPGIPRLADTARDSYVKNLEQRLQQMEDLFMKLSQPLNFHRRTLRCGP
ncbi:hypothetical protein C8Q80DRAFT_151380 [Daedaleopsis nitida]|nr:hypothetical protein C8Q80DRAFT_151380 [Daedaleopsis nitida]